MNIENGKAYVESLVKQYSEKSKCDFEIDWGSGDAECHMRVFVNGSGKYPPYQFFENDLEDCTTTAHVQSRVEKQLTAYLRHLEEVELA